MTTGVHRAAPYAGTRTSRRSVRLNVRDATGAASGLRLTSANWRAVRVRKTCGVANVGLDTWRFGHRDAAVVGVERGAAAALDRHLERDGTGRRIEGGAVASPGPMRLFEEHLSFGRRWPSR